MKRFDRGSSSRALLALSLATLVLYPSPTAAQQSAPNPVPRRYLVLDYMRVTPGKENEYVRLEREVFKPFHAQRVKNKRLVGWQLYEVRYTADTHRDYDYVTVNVYDSLAATDDQSGLVEMFQRMHPGNEGARLMAQTRAALGPVN